MGLDSWRKSRPILRGKCPFRGTCPRKGRSFIFFLRLRPQELCEAFFRGRFFDSLTAREEELPGRPLIPLAYEDLSYRRYSSEAQGSWALFTVLY